MKNIDESEQEAIPMATNDAHERTEEQDAIDELEQREAVLRFAAFERERHREIYDELADR